MITNQSNRIVNLSHLLLSKIINYLDDNIDRIVFTLVCKRWYNDRHRYLSFKTDHINIINDKHKNNMNLNSYKSIYIDSINRKNDYHLYISKYNRRNAEYYMNSQEQLLQMNEIPPNVNTISIGSDVKELEEIYQLISRSNVTTMENCKTLRYRLPENLTSLSFSIDFKDPLFPGYLPPHLKSLKYQNVIFHSKHTIKPGALPNTLEYLFFNQSVQNPFEPGVLPSSLKFLSLLNKAVPKVGSLPPNLEEFKYYSGRHTIEDGVLPLTLQKLTIPGSWLPSIKPLSNLKSLTLLNNEHDVVDLSYLPCSLTQLYISSGILIPSIPPSIKHLSLIFVIFNSNADEIFKDHSNQFDFMFVEKKKIESLYGLNIKELYISMDINQKLPQIPPSVQKLTISSIQEDSFLCNITIPNTLQELVIIDDYKGYFRVINFNNDVLPPSLQSLTLPSIQLPHPLIPNNLVLKSLNTIWLRRLDDHHFLLFSEEPTFISAIVHESDLPIKLDFFK
ncbi:hypothetical protein PPL_06516 [Heterostelium album PN500]|uniref:COI1 F-box domain-containing protein n=1 Tax=Heterostelium pallidum (strain ATCC 26659 / Pp 5 / PN500) TaxID=670386 RepID=D3BDD3_HETP5|nr:hypothetical protein PPL_06516 [Heterostelium album PN500]EFA80577.1 hypothetical protein PPL_06516 [Heterostelium album PN500]|eukprot:XP_020432697.1 hypothetical protein PPL_06516 [Heterostelium album PN500]